MIPFPFNENRFSFFVGDHLLVGQLCTNPKSDRSLLSCLKVTQCSTSEIGGAPLYNSYTLQIQVMTTGPLPTPSKCKSGLPRMTGTILVVGVHATSHLRSRLESQHQSVPGCAEECGDPLLSLPPPPPTWTCWTTSFGHTSRTSPTWPPTTSKPAWSLPSAEYSPSSRRIEEVIEAEGGYIA